MPKTQPHCTSESPNSSVIRLPAVEIAMRSRKVMTDKIERTRRTWWRFFIIIKMVEILGQISTIFFRKTIVSHGRLRLKRSLPF